MITTVEAYVVCCDKCGGRVSDNCAKREQAERVASAVPRIGDRLLCRSCTPEQCGFTWYEGELYNETECTRTTGHAGPHRDADGNVDYRIDTLIPAVRRLIEYLRVPAWNPGALPVVDDVAQIVGKSDDED